MYKTCNNCLFYDDGRCSIGFKTEDISKQYLDKRANVYYSKPLQICTKVTTLHEYSRLNDIYYSKIGKGYSETYIHTELIKVHTELKRNNQINKINNHGKKKHFAKTRRHV